MPSKPLKIQYTAQAKDDVRDARRWYENRSAGLGTEFRHSVKSVTDRLKRFPKTGERVDGEVRRALLSRFPYALFYEPMPERIVVYGVIHTARDDAAWRERLG